jgi:hypothetical protein
MPARVALSFASAVWSATTIGQGDVLCDLDAVARFDDNVETAFCAVMVDVIALGAVVPFRRKH